MPIFVDVEASALTDGFPIEIGWAYADRQHGVRVNAFLVDVSDTGWPQSHNWDFKAQELHGIPFELLRDQGLPLWSLAEILNAGLQGETVYSDSPTLDLRWIEMIYSETGAERLFEVSNKSAATLVVELADRCRIGDLDYTAAEQEARLRAGDRHRAGPDAAYWAHLWVLIESGFRAGSGARPRFGPLRRKP